MQIIGSLPFISTRSRLDLLFSVNYLSLFTTTETYHHLQLSHRILTYLNNTRFLKLPPNFHLHGNTDFYLHVLIGSSYASRLDRKSQYRISMLIHFQVHV